MSVSAALKRAAMKRAYSFDETKGRRVIFPCIHDDLRNNLNDSEFSRSLEHHYLECRNRRCSSDDIRCDLSDRFNKTFDIVKTSETYIRSINDEPSQSNRSYRGHGTGDVRRRKTWHHHPVLLKSVSLPLNFPDKDRHTKQNVRFSSEVSIYEYELSDNETKENKWYSLKERRDFKRDAIGEMQKRRSVLTVNEDDIGSNPESSKCLALGIKKILVVDSHVMFALLLSKSFKKLIPSASIQTARSINEAITLIEEQNRDFSKDTNPMHGYDIIIFSDRIRHQNTPRHQNDQRRGTTTPPTTSVDEFIEFLTHERQQSTPCCDDATQQVSFAATSYHRSFLIGMSTNQNVRDNFEKKGVDLVWGKPPLMTKEFRRSLLASVAHKRMS